MADRGTNVVRSVMLLHQRYGAAWHLRRSHEPLGQPQRMDAPTPHVVFFKKWLTEQDLGADGITTTESSVAQLFVFENETAAKKLEVLVWTIVQSGEDTSFHYAFLLRVVDI
ncbi:hypothetical protein AAVH_34292 [Aphelenchoides avenae]|nr:hypothetical protein AAVH_34292 [Aphelenchus avenae]